MESKNVVNDAAALKGIFVNCFCGCVCNIAAVIVLFVLAVLFVIIAAIVEGNFAPYILEFNQ